MFPVVPNLPKLTAPDEAFKDQEIMEVLLQADEDEVKNGPFNHWSKFQILVQQGKNSESVRWLFLAVSLGLFK